MDVTSRNGGEAESSSEAGIPSGLNRIKTRRVSSKDHQLSSKPDESIESPSFWISRPPLKHKQKTTAHGRGKGRFAFSSCCGLVTVFFCFFR
jgi:hypothetical protein